MARIRRPSGGEVVLDARPADVALLRLDEDDAIGCPGAIEVGGSSIFQNVDGCHVGGVEGVDITVIGCAVHYEEGVAGGVDGA